MDNSQINIASLCTGVGLLDVGVSVALAHLGYRAQPAFMCEWEAYAAATLVRNMEQETLEPCPVWCGDLADFDGNAWRGSVDLLIAGLPCQPYSSAGRQQGNDDARAHGDGSGPVPQAARIIAECQPTVVFFENVPAWVRGGYFRAFGDELSRMGYRIARPLFARASSVGASHRRERVFVMAYRANENGWFGHWQPTAVATGKECGLAGRHEGMGNTDITRPQGAEHGTERNRRAQSGQADRVRRLFAPGPSDDAWHDIVAKHPHIVPAVEPGIRLLVDGRPVVVDESRADQLRCGGNAVVPSQVAAAFVCLFEEITTHKTPAGLGTDGRKWQTRRDFAGE